MMIKTIVIGAGVMAPRSRIGWLRPARLLRCWKRRASEAAPPASASPGPTRTKSRGDGQFPIRAIGRFKKNRRRAGSPTPRVLPWARSAWGINA